MEQMERFDIEIVKKRTLIKYPFFGTVISKLKFKEEKEIPTAGTDGKRVYYNPKFMSSLDEEEQVFVMAHEICHVAFDHIFRSEGKNKRLWNIATDAVINQFLKKDGLPMVKGGIDIAEAINYNAEKYYEKLLKEYNERKQQKLQQPQQQSQQGEKSQQQSQGSEGQQSQGNDSSGGESGQKPKEEGNQEDKSDSQGENSSDSNEGQDSEDQNKDDSSQKDQSNGESGENGDQEEDKESGKGGSSDKEEDKETDSKDSDSGEGQGAEDQDKTDDKSDGQGENGSDSNEDKDSEDQDKKDSSEKDKEKTDSGESDEQEDSKESGKDGSSDKKEDSQSDNQESDSSSSGSDNDDKSQDKNSSSSSGSEGKSDDSQNDSESDSESEDEEVGHDTHSMWEKAVQRHKEGKDLDDDEDEEKEEKDRKENKSEDDDSKKDEEDLEKELSKIDEKDAFEKNEQTRQEQIDELVDAMARASMGHGGGSGSDIRYTKNIGTSRQLLDWRLLLREAVSMDVDWTYQNAEIENGVVTPKLESYTMPETEIVLDTSGSVSEALLKNFLRECKNIINVSKVKVGCFDDEFYGFSELKSMEDIDLIEYPGGGGTNFDAAVEAFTKRVENKIIFTDGCSSMPRTKMNAIWIVYGPNEIHPPGGKVIQITEEQLRKLMFGEYPSANKPKTR